MKFYLGVRSSCPRAAEFACSLPIDVLEFCVRVWERLTAFLAPALGLFNPICKELSRHSCMALPRCYASALCRKREWTVGSLKASTRSVFWLNREPSPQINTVYSHCLFQSSNPPPFSQSDLIGPGQAFERKVAFSPAPPPSRHSRKFYLASLLGFFSLVRTSSPSFPIPSIQFLRR